MSLERSTASRLIVVIGFCLAIVLGLTACGGSSSSSGGETAEATTTESETATPPAEEEGEAEGGEAAEGEAETTSAESGSWENMLVGELGFDMSKYCGQKPMKIGSIDGFGSNTWRVQVRALLEKTASECPNVTSYEYFNANLDPEKYNSTISAWAAQGVNVIVAFDDFGQAAVPAYRAAQLQGVKVVTDNATPGNARVPQDVTAAVITNWANAAEQWVNFFAGATKGTAKVALIGGPAGNQNDTPAIEGIKAAAEKTNGKVELIETEPVVGNWEAAKTQQATTALLTKHPDVNAVVLTAQFVAPAVNQAFEEAGKPLPLTAGEATSNEVICESLKLAKEDPNYQAMSLDATGNQAALALAKGVAAYQEIEAPELGPTEGLTEVNMPVYMDTSTGVIPPCSKTLPPGADLSMAMTEEEVAKATG